MQPNTCMHIIYSVNISNTQCSYSKALGRLITLWNPLTVSNFATLKWKLHYRSSNIWRVKWLRAHHIYYMLIGLQVIHNSWMLFIYCVMQKFKSHTLHLKCRSYSKTSIGKFSFSYLYKYFGKATIQASILYPMPLLWFHPPPPLSPPLSWILFREFLYHKLPISVMVVRPLGQVSLSFTLECIM